MVISILETMMNKYERQIFKIAEQLPGYDAGALKEFLCYLDKTNFDILLAIILDGVNENMITSLTDIVTVILVLTGEDKIKTKHPNQLISVSHLSRLLCKSAEDINLFFRQYGFIIILPKIRTTW